MRGSFADDRAWDSRHARIRILAGAYRARPERRLKWRRSALPRRRSEAQAPGHRGWRGWKNPVAGRWSSVVGKHDLGSRLSALRGGVVVGRWSLVIGRIIT